MLQIHMWLCYLKEIAAALKTDSNISCLHSLNYISDRKMANYTLVLLYGGVETALKL